MMCSFQGVSIVNLLEVSVDGNAGADCHQESDCLDYPGDRSLKDWRGSAANKNGAVASA
jgi:hypothetical protein